MTPKRFLFIMALAWASLAYGAPWLGSLVRPGTWPVIPASVMMVYLFTIAVGTLLAATSTEAGRRALFDPIVDLYANPRRATGCNAIILLISALGAWLAFSAAAPGESAPPRVRAAHPAPPAQAALWGVTRVLQNLTSPYQPGSAERARAAARGKEIYFQNCVFCHGAALAGDGQWRVAFDPAPTDFAGGDSIVLLSEGYLFWRIGSGGAGLPPEGAPWDSAMPAWDRMISAEDAWSVIALLYDHTGQSPREAAARPPAAPPASTGKALYDRHCAGCHGEKGEGDGPAARLLSPPPRDFTTGLYKWKTSGPEHDLPRDEDIAAIIANGAPGTAMPAWRGALDGGRIREIAAYLKSFSDMFGGEGNPPPLDRGVPPPEDARRGREMYFAAKCDECHGPAGKGDAIKRLKEDSGDALWARDLTKPWTFRGGAGGEAIFDRISAGVPNTPMPSHAASATGGGKLSPEDRWHVARHVASLADPSLKPDPGRTAVIAEKTGAPPAGPDDPQWSAAPSTAFWLAPQLMEEERLFTPANDSLAVRALYTERELFLLAEVDDRTRSIPGDERAQALAAGEYGLDALAIQTPLELDDGPARPAFYHGDRTRPVSQMYWRADGESAVYVARGTRFRAKASKAPDAMAKGEWREGTWRVMFRRPLDGIGKTMPAITPGRFIPIAFANWDGSNGERGSRHTLTGWNWLLLREEPRATLWFYPALAFIALAAGQWAFARALRRGERDV